MKGIPNRQKKVVTPKRNFNRDQTRFKQGKKLIRKKDQPGHP